MVVNRLVDDKDIFLDELLRELISLNINYCVIKNKYFYEIHFKNKIYRLIDFPIIVKNISFDDINYNNNIKYKEKNENKSLKSYKKNLIKNDNKKYKTSTKKVY